MAGDVNKQNIIVGAASVYLGDTISDIDTDADAVGTDAGQRPAFAAATSYRKTLNDSADWRNVGYTQEGLEVSYEPQYGDVEVDQLLDSALVFKQSMRVSLNTTLAEATLYNLMIAWGQAASTLTSTASEASLDIEGGSLGEAPNERGLVAVGNSTAGADGQYGERVYHAYRVLNVEASSHSLKRDANTGIPVSLRALPADNGKYGVIKDRARSW